MSGAVEGAPLGVDDLAGNELHGEGLSAPRVGAGHGALDLDEVVVRDDPVLFENARDEAIRHAVAQRLAQGALVIAVASAMLERL